MWSQTPGACASSTWRYWTTEEPASAIPRRGFALFSRTRHRQSPDLAKVWSLRSTHVRRLPQQVPLLQRQLPARTLHARLAGAESVPVRAVLSLLMRRDARPAHSTLGVPDMQVEILSESVERDT